ncbi:hypothetical protein WNY51_17835 [Pseudocolwellia sp. AS88]|uniref:hypothetical protein n=1 Tax=Pseudocolwellia sp. AS88 TaxID=3063958 RepID=UPI0026F29688|nr:hypothetical protein [Pseudocolwellia sp. AS88]MDO7086124.1 hypothetical protein [Pseudocolwellia sp. AS88]
MNVNKKLWSFIFGCLIAASFVWLISLGKSFDVIEYFHQYPEFVVDYYALMITAIATAFLTLFIVLIMKWVFNLLPREHPFWLILPSLTFVGLSFFTSKLMVVSILSAAIPALIVLVAVAVIGRLMSISHPKSEIT